MIVTQGFGPPRETYFAILMDREYSGPTVVASAAGGMDIEQVAASTPEKIVTVCIFCTNRWAIYLFNMVSMLHFSCRYQ